MNTKKTLRLAALLGSVALTPILSHAFDAGSDGSYGAINFTNSTSTPITNSLLMPADGIFRCTSIFIGTNCYVNFTNNALNTPVYLLAQSTIVINGIIDVSGADGQPDGAGDLVPGPGGFAGGWAGTPSANPAVPAGAGQGPGGGRYVINFPNGGSFGTVGAILSGSGTTYGNLLLVPLVGGSGGSGYAGYSAPAGYTSYPGASGGAGGGAILLGASTSVAINGSIIAKGGRSVLFTYANNSFSGAGSGGAIRIVAPTVSVAGSLDVSGGTNAYNNGSYGYGGNGRVRIDTTSALNARVIDNYPAGNAIVSYGRSFFIFPPALPQLYFTTVGGTPIQAGTNNAITLPPGSATNQVVTLCGTNFLGTVPVQIVATPANGAAFTTNIVMNFPTTNILVSTNIVINVPNGIATQLNAYGTYGVQP